MKTIRQKYKNGAPPTLAEFVDLPGFLGIRKTTQQRAPYLPREIVYRVGADPFPNNKLVTGYCCWGQGYSLDAALEDWWLRHSHLDSHNQENRMRGTNE